ncbi:MAG: aminotransferase class III-fold pyridoxal phosphate-dependent enzyme [Bacteroidales bacterium]|nr:aminotransferase class III-fold pyridoxal phosphate-dependent enzyme [Bacteroidales bacterium]
MQTNYQAIQISQNQAAEIAQHLYDLKGELHVLPGELDFNFKIKCEKESYVVKISRPNIEADFLDFQNQLINHLEEKQKGFLSPKVIANKSGELLSQITDESGALRFVRLLSWIDGRLWSEVNPKKENLLFSLGQQAGKLTHTLKDFDHPKAHRKLEWDIAQALWVKDYLHLFDTKQQFIIQHFIKIFEANLSAYNSLRKSVVHNDCNDNNILVSNALIDPEVKAIIDFGDAVFTQSMNDLAIAIAYAVMDKPDPLQASLALLAGYHNAFPLLEEELRLLHNLVAMRLIISVCKSAINKEKEPENSYLLVSEKAAWELLEKWIQINEQIAHYSFRNTCGFSAHPKEKAFKKWAKSQNLSLANLFPTQSAQKAYALDMGVASTWIGHETEYNNNDLFDFKIGRIRKQNPTAIVAGGYLETRPFYITDAYKKEGNSGSEYRSVHLGIDFWIDAETPIHALFDGKVISVFNNDHNKDYGPTVILEHLSADGIPFFSLYGHCSKSTLSLHKNGDTIKQGELLAYVGKGNENGSWAPHLHFQLMLDMLGFTHDFPGVAFPKEADVWKSICPNPNLFFKQNALEAKKDSALNEMLEYRKKHLGKSLSLSYDKPLNIVRGAGSFLLDNTGRKFLDTVNNVAHVGHEHPRIVKAAQNQMAVLNTNTRYLHENINAFAKELLSTFPKELSVVHFVNSGSEANELALRMAQAFTRQKDKIAVEVGYHGNTQACIDISSYKFDGKGGEGAPEHTHIVPLPDVYRGIYQGDNSGVKYATHIQVQIEKIYSKGRNISAFICESIISCGGQIELPQDYLKKAYQTVRKAGGLCIADEVQTGCGRVGSAFWGFQLHDVIPDIVTIGKPIGNGHPLAAVVCTQQVADAFANGMEYFNTFGGNPVSCAIGLEVLRVIKDERLQENAMLAGNYLKAQLKNIQKQFPIIGDVRGQGLFLGFELVDQNKKPLAEHATYLANRMRDLGVLMSTDGKDHNVLKIKPPMVFSMDNANELITRLKIVLDEDFMREFGKE